MAGKKTHTPEFKVKIARSDPRGTDACAIGDPPKDLCMTPVRLRDEGSACLGGRSGGALPKAPAGGQAGAARRGRRAGNIGDGARYAGVLPRDLFQHRRSETGPTFYNWKAKYGGMTRVRGQAAEVTGGRDRQAEETSGRADAGSRRDEGYGFKKVAGSALKREAVAWRNFRKG